MSFSETESIEAKQRKREKEKKSKTTKQKAKRRRQEKQKTEALCSFVHVCHYLLNLSKWIWRSSSQEGHHHGDGEDHPRTFDRRRRPDQKTAMLLLPHSRCAEMGASSHRHGDQIPLRSVFKRTSSGISFTTICQFLSPYLRSFPLPTLFQILFLSFSVERFSSTEHVMVTDSTGKVSASSAVIHAHSCFEVAIFF